MRNMNDMKAAMKGAKSMFWLWLKSDIFRRGESAG